MTLARSFWAPTRDELDYRAWLGQTVEVTVRTVDSPASTVP